MPAAARACRDLTAARRQVAAMSPVFVSGQTISTLTIGSSTIGPRLLDRVEERLLARGDERDFLGIDRMMLAVVNDHAHVLQREAGDRPGDRAPARRLLNSGHEVDAE
jgi:hypothetical protein